MHLTLILTKTPHESPILERCIELALLAGSKGFTLTVYLVGNGVYCAKKGQRITRLLIKMSEYGDVFVRREDLQARGLDFGKIIESVKVPFDFYDQLVENIMEKSDRVITL